MAGKGEIMKIMTKEEMDKHIKEWQTNLLYQEDRDCFTNMTKDQQRLVKLAFRYGQIVGG